MKTTKNNTLDPRLEEFSEAEQIAAFLEASPAAAGRQWAGSHCINGNPNAIATGLSG